jgi:hypothetical protein
MGQFWSFEMVERLAEELDANERKRDLAVAHCQLPDLYRE